MSEPAKFRMPNREIEGEPLHYKISGLDDIYLLNGFSVRKTPYGEGIAIENADNLHRAIGHHLISHRKVLGPKEVRFLRKNMNLTQEELGDCLGVTSQTIARYEKAHDMSGPADRLLRVLYAFHLMPERKREKFIKDLMKRIKELQRLDDESSDAAYFGNKESKWDLRRVEAAEYA